MRKTKHYFFILLCMLLNVQVFSQAHQSWKSESLADYPIYDTLKSSDESKIALEAEQGKIEFEAFASKIEIGDAVGTSYTVKMSDNTTPPEGDISVTYTNLTPNLIDLTSTGTIIAKAKGTAIVEISASVLGNTLKETVSVAIVALESVDIVPSRTELEGTESATYTLSALYSDGSSFEINKLNSTVWSSNKSVASINDDGKITAISAGNTTIELVIKRASGILKKNFTISVKDGGSGIEIADQGDNFNVYPTVVDDEITIESINEISEIVLYDLSGNKVYEKRTQGTTNETINVAQLQSNFFLLKIRDLNGNVGIQKVKKN